MRLHDIGKASFPEVMSADDPEEGGVLSFAMPLIDQILTGYIILFFPSRNHRHE